MSAKQLLFEDHARAKMLQGVDKLAEALALLEEGADQSRVDLVLTDFGMPMGPYALLDQINFQVTGFEDRHSLRLFP